MVDVREDLGKIMILSFVKGGVIRIYTTVYQIIGRLIITSLTHLRVFMPNMLTANEIAQCVSTFEAWTNVFNYS